MKFRSVRKGWRWRFQQTYEFVKDGYNVIHSDLDAVWLKNPLEMIDAKYDIIASMDTGDFHPKHTKNGILQCVWVGCIMLPQMLL